MIIVGMKAMGAGRTHMKRSRGHEVTRGPCTAQGNTRGPERCELPRSSGEAEKFTSAEAASAPFSQINRNKS